MCACGCILVLGLGGALVFCILHGLWLLAAAVLAVAGLAGWLVAKSMKRT